MYIFFLPTAGLGGGGNGNVAKDGVGETQKRPSLVQKAKVSKEKKKLVKRCRITEDRARPGGSLARGG